MHLKVGDRVKVVFPLGDQTGVETVKRFHNKVTVIKDVQVLRKGKSTLGCSYTLAGCKSDWGIDYAFCEEWLVPMDEEVTE